MLKNTKPYICEFQGPFCTGKDVRAVLRKIQSHPKNVYGGRVHYQCAGCRTFNNGQFKYYKEGKT